MRRSRRIRRRNKNKVLVISVCAVLLLMTVGYAAMQTNLEIKAKGNVLKNEIDITENIVTSGDGLYIDTYETEGTRYVYKGTNPNNYIEFNDELWRIIAKEVDGTYKIIRNEILEDSYWSSDGMCSWDYGVPAPSLFPGCNKWEEPALLNTYLNEDYYNTFADDYQNIIVNHNFNIGKIIDNNDLQEQINDEKSDLWEGKVGLITVSEYLKANSNISDCETFDTNNTNNTTCINTNWLFNNNDYWTISAINLYEDNTTVYYIKSDGMISDGKVAGSGVVIDDSQDDKYGVRPTLYLSSETVISDGDGSSNSPFQIK